MPPKCSLHCKASAWHLEVRKIHLLAQPALPGTKKYSNQYVQTAWFSFSELQACNVSLLTVFIQQE